MCPAVFGPSVEVQATPEKRLEDMIRLGELCIEVLQQNDEHHSEVFYLFVSIKIVSGQLCLMLSSHSAEGSEGWCYMWTSDFVYCLRPKPGKLHTHKI